MKNILLAVPREGDYIHREALIPPGIAYINGALRSAGLPVISVNLNFCDGSVEDILEEIIIKHEVQYFLCGGTVYNAYDLQKCFSAAKRIKQEIICIGGGAGYTSDPAFFLDWTGADIAVLGEGEVTEVELLRALDSGRDLKQVSGIIFRCGEDMTCTTPRPVVDHLDDLPFPSYEGLGMEQYFENEKDYDSSVLFDYSYTDEPRVMPMFLGRSCPFGCRFCFHTTGRKYRSRSLDNFFAELDMWIEKYHINGVLLMDELFGGSERRILDFCERMKEYHLFWVAEIRVDMASREVLCAMKESGCTHIQFGLESMSNVVLQDMNKQIRPEQIEAALKNAYDLKIQTVGNFIFGAEAEDQESFLTTFNWWNHHREYQIRLLNIILYPGSDYFRRSLERGLLGEKRRYLEEGMPLVNISKMSDFEWDRMCRVIRMSNIDNVFFGRIIAISETQEELSLEIQCCHCKQHFVVSHVDKKKRFSRRDMVHLCPHCGRNNHYNFDDFKDIMTYEVMSQWIANQVAGCSCTDWLKKKGYRNVGIWGHSLLAELLAAQIKNAAEIRFVSAQDASVMSAYSGLGRKYSIVLPDEMSRENPDAVIVTEVSEYVRSVEAIRASGYTGTIDSLVNCVFDMEYHLIDRPLRMNSRIAEA